MKRSAAPRCGAHIDFSRVLLDDAVAYRQAQPGASATGFGGEKRIKDLVNVFAGNAVAGVDDFHFHAAVVGRRAHFQHSAGRHGVAGIQKQVQEHLLQLVGGTAHRGNSFRQLLDDLNLRSLQGMRHE